MSEIKVLIVEDDPLIAEDISSSLHEMDYQISGVAYSSAEALALLRAGLPDIVLLDINLQSDQDGIDIAEHINSNYHLPVVFLTSYADKGTIQRAKQVRPYGYIVKPFDERDLYSTLEIALFNHSQRHLPPRFTLEGINSNLLSKLTGKEFEVLKNIYEGKTNQQMAESHFVSMNTIKTHVKSIYEKLDAHSRSEAIVRVRELLSP